MKNKNFMSQKISTRTIFLTFGILAVSFLAAFYSFAWTEPSSAPPAGNVPTPVNTGGTAQLKYGDLTVYAMAVSDMGTALLVPNGNVGIGTLSPGERLEISGGNLKMTNGNIVLNGNYLSGDGDNEGVFVDSAGNAKAISFINVGSLALPGCSSANRGQQYLLQGASGIEDGFYICKKKTDGTYEWYALGSPQLVPVISVYQPVYNNDWQQISTYEVPSDAKKIICSLGYSPTIFAPDLNVSGTARITYKGNQELSHNLSPVWPSSFENKVFNGSGGGTLTLEAFAIVYGGGGQLQSYCYYIK